MDTKAREAKEKLFLISHNDGYIIRNNYLYHQVKPRIRRNNYFRKRDEPHQQDYRE